MAASASQWNARYRAQAEEPQAEPAGFVRDLLPLLPLGPALDLACGTGRHALLLASRHQPVTAVDSSAVPLGILDRPPRPPLPVHPPPTPRPPPTPPPCAP